MTVCQVFEAAGFTVKQGRQQTMLYHGSGKVGGWNRGTRGCPRGAALSEATGARLGRGFGHSASERGCYTGGTQGMAAGRWASRGFE